MQNTVPLSGESESPEPSESSGKRVGRYVLLRCIGKGGGGQVFAAFDTVLDRNVALKQLWEHSGSTDDVVREGRLLARLAHPSVVTVHDIAFGDGDEVFLAMELVDGDDFTKWVPAQRDQPGGRAAICRALIGAGEGIAAAHKNGVVHGDVKPSNILVDKEGRARVTDFGVARIVDHAGREPGETGASGDALLNGPIAGTPAYMAPEQHEGQAADQAADQYSFCLTAWEALNGDYPFELDPTERDAAATFSGGQPGTGPLLHPWDQLASAKASWRGGGGVALSPCWARGLRRGLHPDPAQRWPSMEALLVALQGTPSRHRMLWVIGGVAVGAALVGGALAAGFGAGPEPERCQGAKAALGEAWSPQTRERVGAAIARHETGFGERQWTELASRIDAYAAEWIEMHTDVCEATERGEQSGELMDRRMACLQRARAGLVATSAVLEALDTQKLSKAPRIVAGLPPLDDCADLEALARSEPSPGAGVSQSVEAVRELLAQSKALRLAGRVAEAEEVVAAASAQAPEISFEPLLAEMLVERGTVEELAGHYEEAKVSFDEAVKLATKLDLWRLALRAQRGLVYVVGIRMHRPKEGMAYLATVEALVERGGNRPLDRADLLSDRTMLAAEAADYETAVPLASQTVALFAETVGERSIKSVLARRRLANIYREIAKFDEAEAEFRAVVALQMDWLGPDHPEVAETRCDLAQVLFRKGEYASAITEITESLPGLEAVLGDRHPVLLGYRATRAEAFAASDQNEEAESEFLAILEKIGDGPGPEAEVRNGLGNILERQGKLAEAEEQHRKVSALFAETLGADHPNVAISKHNLAAILAQRGQYQEAESLHRQALSILIKAVGESHPQVGLLRLNIGRMYKNQERWADAEAELTAALAVLDKALGPESPQATEARGVLERLSQDRTDR